MLNSFTAVYRQSFCLEQLISVNSILIYYLVSKELGLYHNSAAYNE